MSTRLWGRPTGASPIVSARHSSFPRAWSPNEARWEPRRGVIPELLLDRTALRGRQPPAHRLDETLIARGRGTPQEPMPQRDAIVASAFAELRLPLQEMMAGRFLFPPVVGSTTNIRCHANVLKFERRPALAAGCLTIDLW